VTGFLDGISNISNERTEVHGPKSSLGRYIHSFCKNRQSFMKPGEHYRINKSCAQCYIWNMFYYGASTDMLLLLKKYSAKAMLGWWLLIF
jgi:hypothetical protein